VTLDPSVLAGRFRARGIAADAFPPELFPLLLEPANVARLASSLEAAARDVPPSRDDRPVSLLHALARRQRETASLAGRAPGALGRLPAPLLAALVLLPSAALALRGLASPAPLRRAALHGIVATGAGSLAVSFLLLLSYQEREGALYGALGALTAALLAGLAAGAVAARRLLDARPPSPRALSASLFLAALVFGAAALAPGALSAWPSLPSAAILAAHAALLLVAGAATGALFPAATDALLGSGADAGAAAALFEAADHVGAAAAALLAGVVLVPALGMRASGLLAAALVLLAALDAARAR
jgi:spermidine synthase